MSDFERDLEDDDVVGDKYLDRSLLVNLLQKNFVVLEKSKLPSAIKARKCAWDKIAREFSNTIGKVITVSQLNKLLSNMKSSVKKKTDTKATGNKPIKLKQWEKDLYGIMSKDENPVFAKVPGSLSVGFNQPSTSVTPSETDDEENGFRNEGINSSAQPLAKKIRKSVSKVLAYDTEETKDLTTSQLQRIVLLQQIQLNKMKIERQKSQNGEKLKTSVDVATQTDVEDVFVIHTSFN